MTTLDNDYIDPKDVKMLPTAFKYGLIGALINIFIGLIANVFGLNDLENANSATNWIISIVSYLVIIGTIVMAIKHHRDNELGGFITTGRGIGLGVLTAVIMGALSMVWTYLFLTFIDPSMIDAVQAAQQAQIEAQGLSDEEMEAARPMMEMMSSPGVLSFLVFIGNLIFGLIVSAIAGAVMKKEHPMA